MSDLPVPKPSNTEVPRALQTHPAHSPRAAQRPAPAPLVARLPAEDSALLEAGDKNFLRTPFAGAVSCGANTVQQWGPRLCSQPPPAWGWPPAGLRGTVGPGAAGAGAAEACSALSASMEL